MPADSPCVGVDLAPIKPVTECIALREDITSQRCRVQSAAIYSTRRLTWFCTTARRMWVRRGYRTRTGGTS